MCKRKNKKQDGSFGAENIELRERVNSLRKEISTLREELSSYKAREREIAEALSFAKERSEDYLREARIRYTLETERLKAFSARWTSRLNTLGDPKKLGEEVLEARRFFEEAAREIETLTGGQDAARDPAEEEYYSERARLKDLGALAENEGSGETEMEPDAPAEIKMPSSASKTSEPGDAERGISAGKRLSEDELLGLMAQVARSENIG